MYVCFCVCVCVYPLTILTQKCKHTNSFTYIFFSMFLAILKNEKKTKFRLKNYLVAFITKHLLNTEC